MFLRLLSIFIILYSSNPNSICQAAQCGWRPDSEIIPGGDQFAGGEQLDTWYNSQAVASKAQHPWLVRVNNGRTYGGSGSVVGARWILTAAHLVKSLSTGLPNNATEVTIAVGFNWTDTSLWKSVAEIICHPNSSSVPDGGTKDDICLIRLNQALQLNPNGSNPIQPICLLDQFDETPLSSTPDWTLNATGLQLLANSTARAEVAGYGTYLITNTSGTLDYIRPDTPRRGIMRFMDPEYCMRLYNYSNPSAGKQYNLCLWSREKNGTNELDVGAGDSGGPAIVCPVRANRSGIVQQRCATLGTVSQTQPKNLNGDWDKVPNVKYPRLSAYCAWIDSTTGGEVKCLSQSQMNEDDQGEDDQMQIKPHKYHRLGHNSNSDERAL